MTTLITVHSSDICVGRCDARCYNANKSTCSCICGGVNHGVGLEKAMQNTAEMIQPDYEDWGLSEQLSRFKKMHNMIDDALSVRVPAIQLQLL